MRRTQIYLDDPQDAALTERARHTGRTKSALIREAIDVYLQGRETGEMDALARMRAAIGAATGVAPHLAPGDEYVAELRRSDARRLDELEARSRP